MKVSGGRFWHAESNQENVADVRLYLGHITSEIDVARLSGSSSVKSTIDVSWMFSLLESNEVVSASPIM